MMPVENLIPKSNPDEATPQIGLEALTASQNNTPLASGDHPSSNPEQSLDVSERPVSRYDRLLLCSSGVVFELDPGGKILEINDAIAQVAGYTPRELAGQNWWQVFFRFNPEQGQLLKDRLSRSDVANDDWIMANKTGDLVTLEVNTANQYASNGELERIFGFGLDVTRRRRAEEKLHQSELELAQAQKIAHLGNFVWDLIYDRITWSEELYRIFGENPQEFIPTFDAFLHYVYPDDRDLIMEIIDKALDNQDPFQIMHRIIRADGIHRVIQVRGEVMVGSDGVPVRIVAILQDVTEFKILEDELLVRLQDLQRKEEELRSKNDELARTQVRVDQERRRYQDLFEFAPDGYLVTDANGIIQEANRVAASLLQIRRTDLPGKNLVEYIIPNERDFYSRELHYLNEGEKVRGWETNLQNADGKIIPVAIIAACDSDNQGIKPVFRWLLHNITQLKKAEATLREQKNILQSVLTCMSEAVIVTDNQGRLLTFNPAAEELLHLEQHKHQPVKTWMGDYEFYLPDGETRCPIDQIPMAIALRGEDVDSMELLLRTPFSEKGRWLLSSVRHWKDEDGQVGGGVVVLHDNTGRKHVEQALLESEERYRYLVETAEEGIWVIDDQARTTLVNHKVADMLGYKVDEMLGASYYDFMDEESRAISAMHLERRRQGIREHHDFKFRRKDGTELWTSLATAPLYNAQGEYAGALKLVLDITERRKAERALRESEERYRLVIEAVQDYAIFTLDPEGKVTSWNAGARAIHGYKASEIIGSGLSRFYTPEAAQRGEPQKALELASKQGRCEVEVQQARKDGSRFWANLVLTALRRSDQELRGFSVVMRDITSLKDAEAALLRQSGFVKLLQEIAIAANEASSYSEAIQIAINRICEHTGWQVGHAYMVRRNGKDELIPLDLWHMDEPEKFSPFEKASRNLRPKAGHGLAGRIYQQKEPVWIRDITRDSRFMRRKAARESGLTTAVGFPVLAGKDVVGVLEFFSGQSIDIDEPLMEVMKHIGTQLGRVAERERSQEDLRKSELRFRTIFEGAGIGISLVDLHGYLLEFNPALASILGYQPEELNRAIQKRALRLPGLISGIDEFHELRTGKRDTFLAERLLNHKDGELVWVRLSVTLVRNPEQEPQYAIAMVEDISERRQIQVELSELQSRLVEWLDLQRVTLAKELHDGPLQDMIGLLYHMQVLRQEFPEDGDQSGLADLQKSLQKVTRTLKSICGELRPPTLSSFGLEKAIRSHTSIIEENHPELHIQLDLAPDELTLPERTRLGLYRIYQQAVSNILRHAQASEVKVSLKLEKDAVILEIEDDGKGFVVPQRWIDVARHGQLGLVGAAERAEAIGGQFIVESSIGLGTLVRVIVPLGENVSHPHKD